jgi:hypothetical protein
MKFVIMVQVLDVKMTAKTLILDLHARGTILKFVFHHVETLNKPQMSTVTLWDWLAVLQTAVVLLRGTVVLGPTLQYVFSYVVTRSITLRQGIQRNVMMETLLQGMGVQMHVYKKLDIAAQHPHRFVCLYVEMEL